MAKYVRGEVMDMADNGPTRETQANRLLRELGEMRGGASSLKNLMGQIDSTLLGTPPVGVGPDRAEPDRNPGLFSDALATIEDARTELSEAANIAQRILGEINK